VRAAIASVQADLVQAEPHLKGCLLEPATAHLTIMVLNLPGQVRATTCQVVGCCWLGLEVFSITRISAIITLNLPGQVCLVFVCSDVVVVVLWSQWCGMFMG
jgi:hypothetical protein